MRYSIYLMQMQSVAKSLRCFKESMFESAERISRSCAANRVRRILVAVQRRAASADFSLLTDLFKIDTQYYCSKPH
jgi:hypothetical protein